VLAPVEWLRRHRPGGFPVAVFFGYGCVAVAYLLVRWHYLSGAALPPPPYVVPPSDPGFARFVLDKTCYYLLGEFLLAPIVPIAGVDFLRSHPIPFYVSAAVVGLWVALIAGARIRRPDGAFGLLALLGFMAPVLPVFESPHHLYLPGVGWAVLVTSAVGSGRRKKAGEGACGPVASDLRVRRQVEDLSHKAGEGACGPQRAGEGARGPQRAGEGACGPLKSLGVLIAIVLFATLSFEFGWTLEVAARVQDEVVDEIVNAPQPVQDGQTLYVANLPMVAHYARLAIELQTATTGVRVVALTWAPRLLAVSSPTELRIVDERVIELRIREDRYFGGVIGRLVREATGQTAAELAHGLLTPDFTVEALEHDEGGVSALRFTFHQNLRESQARLFWGSQTRWALPVAP
jgi:hypothetical protein